MARLDFSAKRTVAALMLSPTRTLQLSVVGIGLAIFVGQHLSRSRSGTTLDTDDTTAQHPKTIPSGPIVSANRMVPINPDGDGHGE